jgi:uncharacterized protein YjbJ (UPF0337 family)
LRLARPGVSAMSRTGTDRLVSNPRKEHPVSGESDQMKGRIKQAAGDLTDDGDLKREGQRDEAAGKLKNTVDDVKDKVDDAIDSVKDKSNG